MLMNDYNFAVIAILTFQQIECKRAIQFLLSSYYPTQNNIVNGLALISKECNF